MLCGSLLHHEDRCPLQLEHKIDECNQLRLSLAEREAQIVKMREALQRIWDEDECGYIVSVGEKECVKCGEKSIVHGSLYSAYDTLKHTKDCSQGFIEDALSLTPSLALQQFCKPLVEALEQVPKEVWFNYQFPASKGNLTIRNFCNEIEKALTTFKQQTQQTKEKE